MNATEPRDPGHRRHPQALLPILARRALGLPAENGRLFTGVTESISVIEGSVTVNVASVVRTQARRGSMTGPVV